MKRLLASCFGLGRLPIAPGTWGSLPPAIIFGLMWHFGASAVLISVVMAALALAGSVVCVKCAPVLIAATGKSDPRVVVADEFAGQALTFLVIAVLATGIISTRQIWVTTALGFLLFRLFDIVKPWPIRKLEKLPKGWGVLLDDLLAGAYAGIMLLLCYRFGLIRYISEMFAYSDKSSINILYAAILGAIQGLTEFLPVSSSGHLVLLETFFKLNPEDPQMVLFDLVAHVGTVVAIIIVFRKPIAAFLKNLIQSSEYGGTPFEIYERSPSVHVLVLAIVASVITGILGLSFRSYFLAARGNLTIVASMWVITGTLLLISDWRKETHVGLRQFGILAAMAVGVSQAAAIMPGISRSGATICVAILIGLRRRWAVEFSFLLAIPAILGATAMQLIKDFEELSSGRVHVGAVVTGFAVAALVGVLALKLLVKSVRRANLKFFAFYCYILGCFLLFYLLK